MRSGNDQHSSSAGDTSSSAGDTSPQQPHLLSRAIQRHAIVAVHTCSALDCSQKKHLFLSVPDLATSKGTSTNHIQKVPAGGNHATAA